MVNNLLKRVGFAGLALLTLSSTAINLVSHMSAKAESASKIAGDWGLTVSPDKKNIVWSADKITATWINAGKIEIKSSAKPELVVYAYPDNEKKGFSVLYDQRVAGVEKNYTIEGWSPCHGSISWNSPSSPEQPVSKVSLDMDFLPDSVNGCLGGSPNKLDIIVKNPENSIAYFKWIDAGTIQTIDGSFQGKGEGKGIFKQAKEYPNLFVTADETNEGSCQDRVVVSTDKKTLTYYSLSDLGTETPPAEAQTTCKFIKQSFPTSGAGLTLVDQDKLQIPAGQGAVEAAGTGGVLKESCYTSGGVFAFLLCPILDAIDKFTNWAEGVITDQLAVDLGDPSSRKLLQDTWARMAKIAEAMLAIIALVMIVSTALGFGLFNSYTIKKVIPRLAIGAVGIAFSWALVTYYIDFVNTIGRELAGIMLSQFGGAKDFSLTTIAAEAFKSGGNYSGALFTGLSIAAIGVAGWMGIAGVAIPAALAFAVAIATLAVRKAIIIFLVILSPLAIAAWILPNTQGLWKKWSSTLNKLLIMYPMIMGLLAAGKIFSLITIQAAKSDNGGTIDNFLAIAISIIAYIGPLFMIPGLVKASNSMLGKVSSGLSKQTGKINAAGQDMLNKRKAMKGFRADANAYENRNAKAPAGAGYWGKANAFQKRNRAKARIAGKSFRQGSLGYGEVSDMVNSQVTNDFEKKSGELASYRLKSSGWGAQGSEYEGTDSAGNPVKVNSERDAQTVMANGGSVTVTDRNGKKTVFDHKTDPTMRNAIFNKMAKDGNVEAVRAAIDNGERPDATPQQKATMALMQRAMTENPEKLMAAAPDLYKKDGAFKEFKGKDVAGWDKSTLDKALRHISRPLDANYTQQDKQQAWATFSAALETISTSTDLRAGFGPGQIKQIWETVNGKDGNAGIGIPSDLDQDTMSRVQLAFSLIQSDGTLGRMPSPELNTQQQGPQAGGGQLPPPDPNTQQPAPPMAQRMQGLGHLISSSVPGDVINEAVQRVALAKLQAGEQVSVADLQRKLSERLGSGLVPVGSVNQLVYLGEAARTSFPQNENDPMWRDANAPENASAKNILNQIIMHMLSDV